MRRDRCSRGPARRRGRGAIRGTVWSRQRARRDRDRPRSTWNAVCAPMGGFPVEPREAVGQVDRAPSVGRDPGPPLRRTDPIPSDSAPTGSEWAGAPRSTWNSGRLGPGRPRTRCREIPRIMTDRWQVRGFMAGFPRPDAPRRSSPRDPRASASCRAKAPRDGDTGRSGRTPGAQERCASTRRPPRPPSRRPAAGRIGPLSARSAEPPPAGAARPPAGSADV